jgi:hypothetical protein
MLMTNIEPYIQTYMLMYDNLERKIALAMPSHLSMFRSFDEVVAACDTFSQGRDIS